MIINEIKSNNDYLPLVQQKNDNIKPKIEEEVSFANTLNGLIMDTNNLQVEASNLTESMIKGESVDIHDVMIATQKAKTSFQLLMELRNKGRDLYIEIIRMQI